MREIRAGWGDPPISRPELQNPSRLIPQTNVQPRPPVVRRPDEARKSVDPTESSRKPAGRTLPPPVRIPAFKAAPAGWVAGHVRDAKRSIAIEPTISGKVGEAFGIAIGWAFFLALVVGVPVMALMQLGEDERQSPAPSYSPTPAILSPSVGGADLDCIDIGREIWVGDYDPNFLDADGDGWGCEGW